MKKLVYLLVYPLLWLMSKLPMRILYIKSDVLFVLLYTLIGYRRKVIASNLALAFPKKPEEERKKIARDFYRHLCDVIVETIKSISISEKELQSRFVLKNPEVIQSYYKNSRSVLLLTGHYANWEWSSIINTQLQHKGFAVYKPLRNPYFDKLVRSIRGRFKATIVSNKRIAPLLYRSTKQGHITLTYILSDQTPKAGAFKHTDSFMDVEVPVFTGPEEMAKKLDLDVLYLNVKKEKRGYYSATVSTIADSPSKYPDFEITRKFLDALEAQIKEAPAFYLWSHKRWKLRVQ